MTINDAIRELEEMRELFGGHVPVKLLNKREQFRINRRNEQDLDTVEDQMFEDLCGFELHKLGLARCIVADGE